MSEKTTKEKNGNVGPASKPAKAKTVKNRKGKTSEPELQGQRADGKAEKAVHHRKLVAFSLKAPQTSLVFLAGCFNGWDPHATPLHWHEDGVWICSVSLEPGEHQYRFIVDGEWQNDPLNTRRLSNAFGTENCVLVVDR